MKMILNLSYTARSSVLHSLKTIKNSNNQGHLTNLFLTLSVPQSNLAGWQESRCSDELAGKFVTADGLSWY